MTNKTLPIYEDRGWPTETIKNHSYHKEFERISNHKKAAEMLIEMIFKPTKYPGSKEYFKFVHEEWFKYIGERNGF